MKIEIEVRDEEVVERVVMAVTDRIDAKFSDLLEERITDLLEERLKKLTDERITAQLDKVLSEGWRPTNSYGQPTGGEKLTLSTKVLGYLTSNSYDNPLDRLLREHLERAMKGEMGKLIEEATAKLRAALDQSVAEKLRKAVTEVLR